jgi:ubiquinone/menaquinone biosynthesis C-methylase UbiE
MPDAIFENERLAAIYDAHDSPRDDLDHYIAIVAELGAHTVLDVGCGTGTFAIALAERGCEVIGVDPARASLEVAQEKPGSERVRWIHSRAAELPALQVDLATMTGNVAQAVVEPEDWAATLTRIRQALRPTGHLVFEVRDPAFEGWREWTRAASHRVVEVPGRGPVESWVELTTVELPLVSFRWTFVFPADDDVLTSDSTLRFRSQTEIEADLLEHGLEVEQVRDAPDRPGRELVFIARVR